MDNVEEVEDEDVVMDLEEAEDLVRQREEEQRIRIQALISRPGDGSGDLAGWLQPSTSAGIPAASKSASLSASLPAGGAVGGSASVVGVNPMLLQLLMEQQTLLKAAEERRAAPAPSPKFQLLNRGEKAAYKPLPVTTNTGILLGAQLGKLSLGSNPGRTLSRVDVLHANQQQMHEHQLQLLRKQQIEAAEIKVELFFRVFDQ